MGSEAKHILKSGKRNRFFWRKMVNFVYNLFLFQNHCAKFLTSVIFNTKLLKTKFSDDVHKICFRLIDFLIFFQRNLNHRLFQFFCQYKMAWLRSIRFGSSELIILLIHPTHFGVVVTVAAAAVKRSKLSLDDEEDLWCLWWPSWLWWCWWCPLSLLLLSLCLSWCRRRSSWSSTRSWPEDWRSTTKSKILHQLTGGKCVLNWANLGLFLFITVFPTFHNS